MCDCVTVRACVCVCVVVVICIWEPSYSLSQYDLTSTSSILEWCKENQGFKKWCYHVISIFLFNSSDYIGTFCRIYTPCLFSIQYTSCAILYLSSLATGMLPRPRSILHTIALWNSLSLIPLSVAFSLHFTFLYFQKHFCQTRHTLHATENIYNLAKKQQ